MQREWSEDRDGPVLQSKKLALKDLFHVQVRVERYRKLDAYEVLLRGRLGCKDWGAG